MPGQIVNRSQLAALLGHDVNTIDGYVTKGMPFKTKANRAAGIPWEFDTADVVKWLQVQAMGSAAPEGKEATLQEAQKRKALADAEMAELDLRKRKGELVEMADVIRAGSDSYNACKTRLLAMGTKLAPMLAAESDVLKCRDMVEVETVQALNELGYYEPEPYAGNPSEDPADGDDLAPSAEAAAKADRQRVGRSKPKAKPGSK